MIRKAVVIIYIFFLGVSWLQLLWFFGIPSVGGFILTPSAHPYIPPLSLVLTVPSNTCEGWSVKLVDAKLFGVVDVKIPVVHYFSGGYEVFNYYVLTDNVWDNIANYFKALIFPHWVAYPYNGPCVARVIFVIPAPLVILISIIALTTKLYYGFRRVW